MSAYSEHSVNTDPPDDAPSRKKQLAVREVSVNTTFRILPGRINVSDVKCEVYAPKYKRYRIVVF
jgi:hypothetical protein